MAYEVQITSTNVLVSSSSTVFAVNVNSPAQPVFTITNQVSAFSIDKLDSTTTIYTDAVELVLADLNTFWKGEWQAGVYFRGDIVTYQYSQYFLKQVDVDITTPYGSTVPPPEDSNWIRFNWHEAPFAVFTATGPATFQSTIASNGTFNNNGTFNSTGIVNLTSATIGKAFVTDLLVGGAEGQGFVINNTATFNGPADFYNTATIYGTLDVTSGTFKVLNMTVTNQLTVGESFVYNGLEYPKDKGLFGQVLYTNGDTAAAWVNLGELVFWSLSNNLFTNGFDIYTNSLNQDLGIGVSNTFTFTSSPAHTFYRATGQIDSIATGSVQLNAPTVTINASTLQTTATNRVILRGGSSSTQSLLYLQSAETGQPHMGALLSDAQQTGLMVSNTALPSSYSSADTWVRLTRGNIQLNGRTLVNNTLTVSGPFIPAQGVQFNDGTQTLAARRPISGRGIEVSIVAGQFAQIDLITATNTLLGGVKIPNDSGLTINSDGELRILGASGTVVTSIIAGTGTFVSSSTGDIIIWTEGGGGGTANIDFKAGVGLTVSTTTNGTVTTATYTLNTATAEAIGGIRIGINGGINIDPNAIISLQPALADRIGGVRVPANSGLSIDETGNLSLVGGTATGVLSIFAGTNTNISTSTGAVTIWTDVEPLTTASSTVLGGIKVGNNLTIDPDGTLNASGSISVGDVSLTEDMETNGYDIRLSDANTQTKITLASTTSTFELDVDTKLSLNNTSVVLQRTDDSKLSIGNSNLTAQFDSDAKMVLAGGTAQLQVDNSNRLSLNDSGSFSISAAGGNKISYTTDKLVLRADTITYLDLSRPNTVLAHSTQTSIDLNDNLTVYKTRNSSLVFATSGTFLTAETTATIRSNNSVLTVNANQLNYTNNSSLLNITPAMTTVASTTATIGGSVDNSTLRVQRIYNYAGTFAPFFPAGVQFQDNSVQYTAYIPDQGLLA